MVLFITYSLYLHDHYWIIDSDRTDSTLWRRSLPSVRLLFLSWSWFGSNWAFPPPVWLFIRRAVRVGPADCVTVTRGHPGYSAHTGPVRSGRVNWQTGKLESPAELRDKIWCSFCWGRAGGIDAIISICFINSFSLLSPHPSLLLSPTVSL